MKFTIAILPGDGIGPEIMSQAIEVLNAIQTISDHEFMYSYALVGASAIEAQEHPLPSKTVQTCLEADVVLLGAVGDPKYDNAPIRPEQGLLALRKQLGLFANIRPVKAYDNLKDLSPLKPTIIDSVDIQIFRELSSGIYFGKQERHADYAVDHCYYNKSEIERVTHLAFQAARNRSKKVTLVDKANVLETSRLWREVVKKVHQDYLDIELNFMYVDNAVMQIIQAPKQFDVILTSNMFGDILSDGASVITGTLGMLPSASIGEQNALFEPVHGSYPQASKKDIANPIAMILSTAMMLEYLGLAEEAAMIYTAVNHTVNERVGTEDMSPEISLSCSRLGNLIASLISDDCEEMAGFNKLNIAGSIGTII
ncbi:MAG: 3-isopropylmalate dehydrogenase [Aureispira sp.]|nr:3-isopropylmalate dehydrogenase [Aureispira sp.]